MFNIINGIDRYFRKKITTCTFCEVALVVGFLLCFAPPAGAACGSARQELVGYIPDVFFTPGVPTTKTITYTYKAIDASLNDCGIYARSITEGVSVRASYGSEALHPPFSFAPVGPATSVGAEKTWSFDLVYDGAGTPNTHGLVEILSNTACDVCPPIYRTIGVINVYHYAEVPSTFFTVKASATNIDGSAIVLDHALTNGNRSQLLFVTPNWNPGGGRGVYDTHPVSVRYDDTRQRWLIQHDDGAPMMTETAFNVRIDPSAIQVTARPGQNILWSLMLLRHNNANGNPNAIVFVMPVDNGVRNPHPITVRYVGDIWAIWNADGATMPSGATFNVKVLGYGRYISESSVSGSSAISGAAVDVEGASRTEFNYRIFDLFGLNGCPSAPIILTSNYNPLNRPLGVENPNQVGVWYMPTGYHAAFNQNLATMPTNASFNIWVPLGRCFTGGLW